MQRTCAQTANGTLLSQTVEDGFGRTIEESVPSPAGNLITTRSEYNERGQLIRRTRTDGSTEQAPTLYEYDNAGRISRQITALNGTPTPENSAIEEYAYSAEPADDGLVYAVTRTTRYNAAGEALTSEEKTLISALDPVLESASLRIDERGNATTTRTEYAGGTARLTLTELPGCDTPARSLSIDGFTIEQTDAAGVTTRAARRYTANGMELTQTDGRGNTTTQVTDMAGRTLTLTDAAGATTTTTYAATSDQPATVTDALGNTARYRYDVRGRKVAEWGTAIQPALYRYDDADRLTALTTFRAEGSSQTTDPSSRTDGDTTTWTYDDASGVELTKRYADGSIVTKTYDSFGNPATETNARSIVTSYEYDSFRNLLLAIRYSDGTEDETFVYNHLGQLTQVTDAAGTRTIRYNRYGEAETDSLLAGSMTHTITEQRDTLGRSTGYIYAKNDIPQQQTTIGYGADGRVASAGFTHQGEQKDFIYSYLPGTHLLHTLTHPNGLTLTRSYDATRDLPTDMSYTRADALVVQRSYDYDILGRPTVRNLARYGTETQDTFGYNTRSELTAAHVNSADYSYAYDAIGNRTAATEAGTSTAYTSNRLNQYTAEGSFRPEFDADGNQTLIKTSTGIWNVTYNAKNRPIRFVKSDNSVIVECTYDTMGRRATKKVTTNGTLTEHRRFLYRGYLQIACCDLTRAYTPALWFITWDPTQPTATRPLAIQKNGTWYTYGWDLTKNICETYRTDARIDLAYTYTPYGEVSPAHTYDQPLRWSSEYHDTELGLVYYNYRHYNPAMGRWLNYDPITKKNHYEKISPTSAADLLGLSDIITTITYSYNVASIFYSSDINRNIIMSGNEINEKLTITLRQTLYCVGEMFSKPVFGCADRNDNIEGNSITNGTGRGFGSHIVGSRDAARAEFETNRQHWRGDNKHIVHDYTIPDKHEKDNASGPSYYTIDINSQATAYRDGIIGAQQSSSSTFQKDLFSAMASFFKINTEANIIAMSVPYIKQLGDTIIGEQIPKKSQAKFFAKIVATCDCKNDKPIVNYAVISNTTLTQGSRFTTPTGWATEANSGKFTVDVKVDVV